MFKLGCSIPNHIFDFVFDEFENINPEIFTYFRI